MPPVGLARAIEERGLHSLYVPEHTHIPTSRMTPPPTGDTELRDEYKRTLDPLVALAMCAAATERLIVGTGVCLVAQREPIVTAKAIATLDNMSGGRFVLGMGFGWNADEIADHGVSMPDRRDVAREHVLAMRALWRDDVGFVRREVRADPALLVVAQARASRRTAGAHRRRAGPQAVRARCRIRRRLDPDRRCRHPRRDARPAPARARPPAAIPRRCRSCRSAPCPTPASSSTTSRSG